MSQFGTPLIDYAKFLAQVRDGVLMCAMDNEIAVYSQWRGGSGSGSGNERKMNESGGVGLKDIVDHRTLHEEDIYNLAQESKQTTRKSVGKTLAAADERRKKGTHLTHFIRIF